MEDKTILITGANSGIGKATALILAKQGARIALVCRNKTKAYNARHEIVKESKNEKVSVFICDLADLDSVRKAAGELKLAYPKIDVLVNNAGGYFGKRQVSKDGYEYTFAMNHLGHFLLTNLLLDNIKAAGPARIVNVSSEAQRQGHINFDDLMAEKKYSGIRAYCQAKLANIIFTKGLARRLEGTQVIVNACHPGVVSTGFGAEGGGFVKFIIGMFRIFMRSPEKGAATSVYLSVSPAVEGITGKYFSDCKEKNPVREAQDTEVQEKLWEVSAELTDWKG